MFKLFSDSFLFWKKPLKNSFPGHNNHKIKYNIENKNGRLRLRKIEMEYEWQTWKNWPSCSSRTCRNIAPLTSLFIRFMFKIVPTVAYGGSTKNIHYRTKKFFCNMQTYLLQYKNIYSRSGDSFFQLKHPVQMCYYSTSMFIILWIR